MHSALFASLPGSFLMTGFWKLGIHRLAVLRLPRLASDFMSNKDIDGFPKHRGLPCGSVAVLKHSQPYDLKGSIYCVLVFHTTVWRIVPKRGFVQGEVGKSVRNRATNKGDHGRGQENDQLAHRPTRTLAGFCFTSMEIKTLTNAWCCFGVSSCDPGGRTCRL